MIHTLFHVPYYLCSALSFLSSCIPIHIQWCCCSSMVVVVVAAVVFVFIYIVSFRLRYYRLFANFHPFKSFCTYCVFICCLLAQFCEQKISDVYFPKRTDEAHVMHIVIMNIQAHTHATCTHHTHQKYFFFSVIQH